MQIDTGYVLITPCAITCPDHTPKSDKTTASPKGDINYVLVHGERVRRSPFDEHREDFRRVPLPTGPTVGYDVLGLFAERSYGTSIKWKVSFDSVDSSCHQ